MKKLYLLTLVFFSHQVYATNPVPNASFDNWTSGTPDGWITSNVSGYAVITQTSTAHSSTYAAKGEPINTGTGAGILAPYLVSNSFAITQRYGSLQFYYQGDITAGDEFVYNVVISTAHGTAIATAQGMTTTSTNAWTNINLTINYTYDSVAAFARIGFSIPNSVHDPNPGSFFIVDDVSLTGAAAVEEINAASSIQVSPVPAHDFIKVSGLPGKKPTTLTLMDVTGRIITHKEVPSVERETAFNLEGFNKGFYFLLLASDEKTLLRRIAIE